MSEYSMVWGNIYAQNRQTAADFTLFLAYNATATW